MKFIDPGFKGNNPGHYSTAVVSNGMLYVSGLLSMDPGYARGLHGQH